MPIPVEDKEPHAPYAEVALYLGVSVKHLQNLVSAHRLPTIRCWSRRPNGRILTWVELPRPTYIALARLTRRAHTFKQALVDKYPPPRLA